MSTDLPPRSVRRLTARDLSPEIVEGVTRGALATVADVATISVTGSGAVTCLQGVVTNDIEAPGTEAFVYGAVLTPKGMIIADLWLARTASEVRLHVPAAGKEALLEVFQRSLPPRLARAEDRSAEFAVIRVLGPNALRQLEHADIVVPAPGRVAESAFSTGAYMAARPPHDQPFVCQFAVPHATAAEFGAALHGAEIPAGSLAALELANVLAGWPSLQSEIDGKTLPQEVRFDENDGVSYSKGCFTGQETVARIHFRGHVNRRLLGLLWDEPPNDHDPTIRLDDTAVGRVTTTAWFAPIEGWIGLGLVRREVDPGAAVVALGAAATVRDLPFDFS